MYHGTAKIVTVPKKSTTTITVDQGIKPFAACHVAAHPDRIKTLGPIRKTHITVRPGATPAIMSWVQMMM